jgi:hypothetical protein
MGRYRTQEVAGSSPASSIHDLQGFSEAASRVAFLVQPKRDPEGRARRFLLGRAWLVAVR